MSARSLGVLARCASALVALASLGSCVDDGVSLQVICPIPPEVDGSICVFDPAGEVCTLEGIMNLDVADVYSTSLRVQSGLKAREREVPPRGETNAIQVQAATVDLRLPSGERIQFEGVPNPFRVVASGYVPPEGLGVVALDLITPQHKAVLQQISGTVTQVVVHIQLEGRTSGSTKVTSSEYVWPVRLMRDEGRCFPMEHCPSLRGQDFYANACPEQP